MKFFIAIALISIGMMSWVNAIFHRWKIIITLFIDSFAATVWEKRIDFYFRDDSWLLLSVFLFFLFWHTAKHNT